MNLLLHSLAGNIFGIGDCTNVPTSRTAAACSAEANALKKNLFAVMKGKTPTAQVRTQQGDLADTIQVLEGLEWTNTYGWYKIIQLWKRSSKNPYLDDYYLKLIHFQILSCTWVSIACRPAHKQWICTSYQLDTRSHIRCYWGLTDVSTCKTQCSIPIPPRYTTSCWVWYQYSCMSDGHFPTHNILNLLSLCTCAWKHHRMFTEALSFAQVPVSCL